ncbi:MAG: hypothetical protein R6X06_06595 [Gammaproteobacteria bacterium]
MSNMLAILLNGIAQLEYDRNKALPDHQELYLDKMDAKMDDGIMIGDALVKQPDKNQRLQFVAGNLAHAIISNNEDLAAAMCTYLAVREPDLKQLKIDDRGEGIAIELDYDEPYHNQTVVQFSPLH